MQQLASVRVLTSGLLVWALLVAALLLVWAALVVLGALIVTLSRAG